MTRHLDRLWAWLERSDDPAAAGAGRVIPYFKNGAFYGLFNATPTLIGPVAGPKVIAVNANRTLSAADKGGTLIIDSGADRTITLPELSTVGGEFPISMIKSGNANTVTVNRSGSDTITETESSVNSFTLDSGRDRVDLAGVGTSWEMTLDNRQAAVSARVTADQTVNALSFTKVNFDTLGLPSQLPWAGTINSEKGSGFNTAGNYYEAPYPGLYLITIGISSTTNTSGDFLRLFLGTDTVFTQGLRDERYQNSAGDLAKVVTALHHLDRGQRVAAWVQNFALAARTIERSTGSDTQTYFGVVRVPSTFYSRN